MIKHVQGDLFQNLKENSLIIHVCNDIGSKYDCTAQYRFVDQSQTAEL
jgi:hypothetical protein